MDPVLLLRVASLPFETLDMHRGHGLDALDAVLSLEHEIANEAAALEAQLFTSAGPAHVEEDSAGGGIAVRTSLRTALLAARRDVHNRRRSAIERDAVRITPEHPAIAKRLQHFADQLSRLERALDLHCSRHAEALTLVANRLAHAQRDPLVAEGLLLVSRSLSDKAAGLSSLGWERWTHRERHTALKVLAYLTRFTTKTSPHGVFCSTALGRFGESVRCAGQNTIAGRETLLAVGEARKITACLAVDSTLSPMVIPRPNPTLREREGTWTFWRPASARHENDDEVLSRIPVHPVARALLESCAPDRTLSDVISEASRRIAIPPAELEVFAGKLTASGLWIAEVEIPWSERKPLSWLAKETRAAGCAAPWLAQLEQLQREVEAVDSGVWDERRERLLRIPEIAETLPHARPLDHDGLLRADTASGIDLTLPRDVLPEIERFLGWYARLCAALHPREVVLDSYVRRFLSRFPADQDVELLDVYHGVFEDEDDLRPAAFPAPSGATPVAQERRAAFQRVRDCLARAARSAERHGREDVPLESLDWEAVLPPADELRWSCGVLFQVEAADQDAIRAGRYRLAINAIYPGGGLASARLAELHAGGQPVQDGPIAVELRRSWEWLENDGAIVAEVSFMHAARTANAGLRPSLFRHEIELPGDRATPDRQSIPLADLIVRFETATRRFVLRSRERGIDVKPIVASGISPHGIVSFLIAIGQQELQPLPFFPGFDDEGIVRWPRFTLGRTVVFRRRWVFRTGDLPATEGLPPFDPARTLEIARWRRRHALPRHVFVHDTLDPKPFYADLESPWHLELLRARLAKAAGTATIFTEMLPGPDAMWVADGRGRYATEFLVHLQNVGGASAAP